MKTESKWKKFLLAAKPTQKWGGGRQTNRNKQGKKKKKGTSSTSTNSSDNPILARKERAERWRKF